MCPCSLDANLSFFVKLALHRLEEEIARMKKNQERRLHRKNAKIAKEGGTLMTLNRPIKPDTTVCPPRFYSYRGPYWPFSSPCHPRSLTPDMFSPSQRRCGHCGQMGHMSTSNCLFPTMPFSTIVLCLPHITMFFSFRSQKRTASVHVGQNSTRARNHQLRLRQFRLLRLDLRVVHRR